MIDSLDALPALTRSWLAPLEEADPELHAELAETMIVTGPGAPSTTPFPAGVGEALAALDLGGKEIGAFRFAPAAGRDAAAQILAYDADVRSRFDASSDLVFVGDYGTGSVFASQQGIGLLDVDGGRIIAFAPDFTTFLLVQANAYDAYKRHIVKAKDEGSYRAAEAEVAATPAFARVEVAAIFTAQLKS